MIHLVFSVVDQRRQIGLHLGGAFLYIHTVTDLLSHFVQFLGYCLDLRFDPSNLRFILRPGCPFQIVTPFVSICGQAVHGLLQFGPVRRQIVDGLNLM